jgi:ABC transporter DrrB family efflux protein
MTTAAVRRRPRFPLLTDVRAMTWRNLVVYTRVPQLVVFSTIQPVMFVLLFRYVFGGAINIAGVDYPTYLMAGIFAQTAMFGAIGTGLGLATDLESGFIPRLKSLPMSRAAVLIGRTLADVVRNIFVIIVLIAVGLAVGFRPASLGGVLLGVGLMLLFSFAMSWVFALIGLRSGSPEATQASSFPIVFPLVFASGAFVPTITMPDWLGSFAREQPVGVTVTAMRSLLLGDLPPQARAFVLDTTDSTTTLVLKAVGWAVGITAVFGILAVRRYRRVA